MVHSLFSYSQYFTENFETANCEKAVLSASIENGDHSTIDEEPLEPCIKFLKKRVEKSFASTSYHPSSNYPFVEASFTSNQNRTSNGHRVCDLPSCFCQSLLTLTKGPFRNRNKHFVPMYFNIGRSQCSGINRICYHASFI